MPNKKRRSNRKSGLTKQNLLSLKSNIGKGVSSGVRIAEEYSRPMRKHLAEEYLKQGASMDDLMNYSGFLSDLKKFLLKCKINSKINDDIFYHSMNELMKNYDDNKKYTIMVQNTFNSSLVHSTLPEEVKQFLLNTDKISNTKMDGLLQILYREMILEGDVNIDPEHMIPDSGGIGFQATRESQRVRPIRSKINELVSQIKRKDKALKVRGLTPSQKYTLRSEKKELVDELSGIIGTPDTEEESLYALKEIKELSGSASKNKRKKTKGRKRR
mgnify:CR=1 FL=1|tara:strand:- start:165 stop:980 length:816 start_codon:yes stop_codon:yes gene_type:complete